MCGSLESSDRAVRLPSRLAALSQILLSALCRCFSSLLAALDPLEAAAPDLECLEAFLDLSSSEEVFFLLLTAGSVAVLEVVAARDTILKLMLGAKIWQTVMAAVSTIRAPA